MHLLYFTNPDVTDGHLVPDRLRALGENVTTHTGPVTVDVIERLSVDFVVSDRSRHLLKADAIERLGGRVVNLHPSYLPYGRGYQPIFWAIFDRVPVGYTLHYIDPGIDSGDIIDQAEIRPNPSLTLRELYAQCRVGLIELLLQHWPALREGGGPRRVQQGTGTLHYAYEFDGLLDMLPNGWDSSVAEITTSHTSLAAARERNRDRHRAARRQSA